MGHTRPRYNQKGRAVQRQSGKRKLQEVDDSNAEILDTEVREKRRAEVSQLFNSSEELPGVQYKFKASCGRWRKIQG